MHTQAYSAAPSSRGRAAASPKLPRRGADSRAPPRARARTNLDVGSVESIFDAEQTALLTHLTETLMKNSSLRATGRRTRKSRRACAQLLTFSRGCEWVLAKLEKVYDGLTTDAASDARASDLLIDSCAPDDSELGRLALDYARRGLAGDKTPLPSADATSAARLVDHRSAESFQFLSPLRENERLEIARRRAAVALPAAADLDRTLRYEKTITQS